MSLNFAGRQIPGIHTDADIDPPEAYVDRTHFPGLNGVTEKRFGRGGRHIRYEVVLFDRSFTSAAQVTALLEKFDAKVLTHGTLKESGNISRTFENVTFMGCKPLHSPIPDHAKTLVPGVVTYHCRALLIFFQCKVDG